MFNRFARFSNFLITEQDVVCWANVNVNIKSWSARSNVCSLFGTGGPWCVLTKEREQFGAASRRLCAENHFLIDRMEQYLKIFNGKQYRYERVPREPVKQEIGVQFFSGQNCMVFFRAAAPWQFLKKSTCRTKDAFVCMDAREIWLSFLLLLVSGSGVSFWRV